MFQYGFVPVTGNNGLYDSAASALAAYKTLALSYAALPQAADSNAYSFVGGPVTFTLSAAQNVRFFILDYPFNDNRDGVSLFVNAQGANGAVPEPASWAMMIAGFGLIGASMRRRCASASSEPNALTTTPGE